MKRIGITLPHDTSYTVTLYTCEDGNSFKFDTTLTVSDVINTLYRTNLAKKNVTCAYDNNINGLENVLFFKRIMNDKIIRYLYAIYLPDAAHILCLDKKVDNFDFFARKFKEMICCQLNVGHLFKIFKINECYKVKKIKEE